MSEPWHKRLFALPHVKREPGLLLHQTLDKLPRIKAVTMVIQWDDDTFDCDWSPQPVSTLCMASIVLDEMARRVAMGGDLPHAPEPA